MWIAANFALVAEAGCTLAAVQDAALQADRLFPLSLGSEGTCQIGGNLATNAGGTAVLRYGMMRELAFGLEAVLADGSVISQLSPLAKDNTGYDLTASADRQRRHAGRDHRGLPQAVPATARHGNCLGGDPLAQLPRSSCWRGCEPRAMTGSRRWSWFRTPRWSWCCKHIQSARDPGIAASPWYLLVELTSGAAEDLDALLAQSLAAAAEAGLVSDAAMASNEAQRENFWRLRESVPEAQRKAGGSLKHDISVPVASLPRFIEAGAALVARLVPEGYLVAYGHAGDGNLHFNVNQRAGTDGHAFAEREAPLSRAMHDLVAQFGGSISAEHGIGRLKVEELRRYAQPTELAAMHRIKQALDPHGILNPGKVL